LVCALLLFNSLLTAIFRTFSCLLAFSSPLLSSHLLVLSPLLKLLLRLSMLPRRILDKEDFKLRLPRSLKVSLLFTTI